MEETTQIAIQANPLAVVSFVSYLGGFMAVSLTDMIQAFFMIFALLILPIIAIVHAGGWGEVM